MNLENSVTMPCLAKKANIPFAMYISFVHANDVQIPPQESISSVTLLQADREQSTGESILYN